MALNKPRTGAVCVHLGELGQIWQLAAQQMLLHHPASDELPEGRRLWQIQN